MDVKDNKYARARAELEAHKEETIVELMQKKGSSREEAEHAVEDALADLGEAVSMEAQRLRDAQDRAVGR